MYIHLPLTSLPVSLCHTNLTLPRVYNYRQRTHFRIVPHALHTPGPVGLIIQSVKTLASPLCTACLTNQEYPSRIEPDTSQPSLTAMNEG